MLFGIDVYGRPSRVIFDDICKTSRYLEIFHNICKTSWYHEIFAKPGSIMQYSTKPSSTVSPSSWVLFFLVCVAKPRLCTKQNPRAAYPLGILKFDLRQVSRDDLSDQIRSIVVVDVPGRGSLTSEWECHNFIV